MVVTSSHNYDGYPFQSFFDIFKQNKNHYNDKKFIEQQSYYQTTYIPNTRYSNNRYNHYQQPDVNSTSLLYSNQLDDPYQSQQTWPCINKTYKHQEKYFDNSFLLTTYTETIPKTYNKPPVHQYEREIQYPPHPVFGNTGFAGIESSDIYGYPTTLNYGGLPSAGLASFRNINTLPPKVRVIFIPQAPSQLQQPCANSLNVPPFLFSRMTQPLCSLPLPPPLPQISSLPLTPAVQQRVIQQCSNPVATFPFTPNWQPPQSFAPTYPSPLQQPSMMPMPSFQAPQYDSQPYFPSAVPPKNMSILSSNTSSSLPYSNSIPSVHQQQNNDYSNRRRAYVSPPSSSLTSTVTDYSWLQDCSAYHRIPAVKANPNVQLSNDRSTQLLHHPVGQEQYSHINTPMTKFTWSHKLPSLPPGAIVISDEYNDKYDTSCHDYFNSKMKYRQHFQDGTKTAVGSGKSAIINNTNSNKSHGKQSNDKASQNFGSDLNSYNLSLEPISTRLLSSLYNSVSCCSCAATQSHSCSSCTSSQCSLDNTFMDKSNKYQIDDLGAYERKRNIDHNKLLDKTPTRDFHMIYEPHTSHWTSEMDHQLKPNDNNPYSWSISSAISNIQPVFSAKNNLIKQTSSAYKMFPLLEEQEEEEENKEPIHISSSGSFVWDQSTDKAFTTSTCGVSYSSIVNNKKMDPVSTTSTSTDD
ncbi:unnamed protein product [Adineta steineri]|uniref:Uncharacterized protein n=1 Tax=Adineta steineri TaxID=433720 RepID=A0A815GJI4_9BILA|nr:unnamed protein product [Adineta steineri]CAF4028654.1 unnamed protein product [Adineta steineri]